MPCIRIKNGFICGNYPVYEYGGFRFEMHPHCGPVKLRQDGTAAKKTGKKFYEAVATWAQLYHGDRELYRTVTIRQ